MIEYRWFLASGKREQWLALLQCLKLENIGCHESAC